MTDFLNPLKLGMILARLHADRRPDSELSLKAQMAMTSRSAANTVRVMQGIPTGHRQQLLLSLECTAFRVYQQYPDACDLLEEVRSDFVWLAQKGTADRLLEVALYLAAFTRIFRRIKATRARVPEDLGLLRICDDALATLRDLMGDPARV